MLSATFWQAPQKSSKKRLELLVIPLICVHAVFFPTLPFIVMTVLISGLPVVIRYAADYGQTRKEKFQTVKGRGCNTEEGGCFGNAEAPDDDHCNPAHVWNFSFLVCP